MQEYGNHIMKTNKDIMGMHIFLLVLYSKLNNSIIIRIITGATERSNINSMYEDLGWVSLSRRRLIHRLTLFYKITNNMTPKVKGQHQPDTRTKTTLYKIILSATIREWNSLPMEVRNYPTLSKHVF